MKRKALGKGLRSLIPQAPPRTPAREVTPSASPSADGLRQIDLDLIRRLRRSIPIARDERPSLYAEWSVE